MVKKIDECFINEETSTITINGNKFFIELGDEENCYTLSRRDIKNMNFSSLPKGNTYQFGDKAINDSRGDIFISGPDCEYQHRLDGKIVAVLNLIFSKETEEENGKIFKLENKEEEIKRFSSACIFKNNIHFIDASLYEDCIYVVFEIFLNDGPIEEIEAMVSNIELVLMEGPENEVDVFFSKFKHKYKLLDSKEMHGANGYCVKAKDLSSEIDVVIKFFKKTISSHLDLSEYQITTPAKFIHENIAMFRTVEYFKCEGRNSAAAVWDYIDGVTLDVFIEQAKERTGSDEQHQLVETIIMDHIIPEIIGTIEFIHRKGYAHGDLHSGNIMITLPAGEKNKLKPIFLDFGSKSHFIDEPYVIKEDITINELKKNDIDLIKDVLKKLAQALDYPHYLNDLYYEKIRDANELKVFVGLQTFFKKNNINNKNFGADTSKALLAAMLVMDNPFTIFKKHIEKFAKDNNFYEDFINSRTLYNKLIQSGQGIKVSGTSYTSSINTQDFLESLIMKKGQ